MKLTRLQSLLLCCRTSEKVWTLHIAITQHMRRYAPRSSANTHPSAQMSTAAVYWELLYSSSGARYHLEPLFHLGVLLLAHANMGPIA